MQYVWLLCRNNYNKTALTMAEENKNYKMAEILIKYGAVR